MLAAEIQNQPQLNENTTRLTMHTTKGQKVTFNHNSDFSGSVIIFDRKTRQEMRVPFTDLKMLVAAYVRAGRIDRIEQQGDDATLGL